MRFSRETVLAAAKASKKKKAPEEEGRGREKKRRVGEPPKGPSAQIVEVASSRSSGGGGVQEPALKLTVTQGVHDVTPEAGEGVPPAPAPIEVAPPTREASSPRIPTGAVRGLGIRNADRGKGSADSA